ncbi:hypothetical protein HDV05_000774 [Chytridiales sp. JEL 0842]|nr:hypothetical protein HDV05_000774 [Chytridiales sp. JEL 0842]
MNSFKIRTELTDLLGILQPIICPPMASVSNPDLVSAINNAGCLGFLAVGYNKDPEILKEEMRQVKLKSPGKPLGVGFITWTIAEQPQMFDAILEDPPQAVWFSFGDASSYIHTLKSRHPDTLIFVQTHSVSTAILATDSWGADVIIAQGSEAGGHGHSKGQGIWTLMGEVNDAVGDRVCVVAAGGVTNGKQLAAALLLGVSGVVIGTRLCASKEASLHPSAKQRLIESNEGGQSTIRTRVFEGLRNLKWPLEFNFRVLRNDVTDSSTSDENAKQKWGPQYAKEREKLQLKNSKPDFDVLHIAAGEGIGLIRGVWPVKKIIEKTLEEAREAFFVAASVVDNARAKL